MGLRFIISLSLVLAGKILGATYYVDYSGGSDAAAGTSTGAAWKHCPGDANATGSAASASLLPGDTVNFKGGVVYRGSITLSASGSAGNQITYQTASGWGTGTAIISGADLLSQTWVVCTNSADCWNNANWSNIWHTTIPSGLTLWNRLFQDTEMLHIAQAPTPSDYFNWDRVGEWYLADAVITRTNLISASVLVQADTNYYNGSWVGVWVQQNRTSLQPITSFSPTTHAIGFTLASVNDPYTDPAYAQYTILNHPALIGTNGQYAIRPDENRIYLWAKGNINPNTVTISTGGQLALFHGYQDYLTFNGLTLANTFADPITNNESEAGVTISVGAYPTVRSGVIATNCVFRDISSPQVGGHVIYLYNGGGAMVRDNVFTNCIARGIIISGGTNNIISNNVISHVDGTAIEVWFTSNTVVVANSIEWNTGLHANALTAYDGNNYVYFRKNKVRNSARPLTFQACTNLSVENNIFDGGGIGSVREWNGTMSGYVRFLNNTIINAGVAWPAIDNFGSAGATYTLENNIIDGGGILVGTHAYNLYTSLASYQIGNLGTNEVLNTNLVAIIPGFAVGNYMISDTIGSGYAKAAGVNLSSYGLLDDYVGNPRSSPWDIGAYQSSPPPPTFSVQTLIIKSP